MLFNKVKGVKNTDELIPYQAYYNEPKLWTKLAKVASRIGRTATFCVVAMYYVMISPDVPVKNKAIICGALGYLILPADLIPDLIPILGFTDDVTAIKLAYDAIKASISPDIKAQAEAKVSQWFKDAV